MSPACKQRPLTGCWFKMNQMVMGHSEIWQCFFRGVLVQKKTASFKEECLRVSFSSLRQQDHSVFSHLLLRRVRIFHKPESHLKISSARKLLRSRFHLEAPINISQRPDGWIVYSSNNNVLTILITYLFTYVPIYLLIYLLTFLLTYLLTFLLTFLLSYLFTYLFSYLLIYLLTFLLIYLLTYLLAYFLTYLFTYLFTYVLSYLLT